MRVKIYNEGAYGIPASLCADVTRIALDGLPLKYTQHALREALNDRYGQLPSRSFPTRFSMSDGWTLVECEAFFDHKVDKFVVRKPVTPTKSLVMVIQRDGVVRTLWTNLNSDGHATLNKEKFDKPGAE